MRVYFIIGFILGNIIPQNWAGKGGLSITQSGEIGRVTVSRDAQSYAAMPSPRPPSRN